MKKRYLISFFLTTSAPLCAQGWNLTSNTGKLFKDSPIIYSVLFILFIMALLIGFMSHYALKTSYRMPTSFIAQIRNYLMEGQFDKALHSCQKEGSLIARVMACAIAVRAHGSKVMSEATQAETRRSLDRYARPCAFLKDLALIAPLIGVLGTVMGMFYTFYEVNRAQERFSSIFDGVSLSMGTTFCGLFVGFLAWLLRFLLKRRERKLIKNIQSETLSLGSLMDSELSSQNK